MMMRLLFCFALVEHAGAMHSDVNLAWPMGGGHGACDGPAVQGNDVITVNGNDITITTDAAPNLPNGSCVFRNAQPSITLEEYPNIEVDLATSGSHAAPPGMHGGMWFSFWMYPPQSAYRYTPPESGEVDFVENINSVRTNFAGCFHNCNETEWNQSPVNVSAHVTMKYDRASETVYVYRCKHGSDTCDTSGVAASILLKAFQNPKPYQYTFSADVWYAKPGYNFKFEVSNLRILRDRSTAACSIHAGCKGLAGNCCPTDDGTMLDCCATAACSIHAGCKGLAGNCCPTDDGKMLDCCKSRATGAAKADVENAIIDSDDYVGMFTWQDELAKVDYCKHYSLAVEEVVKITDDKPLGRRLMDHFGNVRSKWCCKLDYTYKTHKTPVGYRNLHCSHSPKAGALSKWLSRYLLTQLRTLPHLITNTADFVRSVRSLGGMGSCVLHKLDVEHYYMTGGCTLHSSKIREFVPSSDRSSIEHNVFLLCHHQYVETDGPSDCEGVSNWHRVTKGSGMGLSHSGELTDAVFWTHVERKMIEPTRLRQFGIIGYYRMKDDIMVISKPGVDITPWMDLFAHSASPFTMTIEAKNAKRVEFLEVAVEVKNGFLVTTPREKSSSLETPMLHMSSAHSPSVHLSWPANHLRKRIGLCTTFRDAVAEKRRIIDKFSRGLADERTMAALNSVNVEGSFLGRMLALDRVP